MNTKNKKQIDIKYGNFELRLDEFLNKNVKVRITTLIDKDILESLKKYSNKKGLKYQTTLNAILRMFFDSQNEKQNKLDENRVRQIIKEELKKYA